MLRRRMTVPGGNTVPAWHSLGTALGRVRKEADPGETRDTSALDSPAEVVAGDPQPGTGEQHVVGPVPARPGVQPGRAGRVADQRAARGSGRQAGQAGSV